MIEDKQQIQWTLDALNELDDDSDLWLFMLVHKGMIRESLEKNVKDLEKKNGSLQ